MNVLRIVIRRRHQAQREAIVDLAVGQLKRLLESRFAGVWVEGELSNVKLHSSGHLYFTLKDGEAALDCVMWASRAGRLRFALEDGLVLLSAIQRVTLRSSPPEIARRLSAQLGTATGPSRK